MSGLLSDFQGASLLREKFRFKLYFGNLASETLEADLRALFEPFGTIAEINIINDRMTGRPQGFAFVRMSSLTEGRAAIDGLPGKGLGGRPLVVNEARAKEDRPRRPRPGPHR